MASGVEVIGQGCHWHENLWEFMQSSLFDESLAALFERPLIVLIGLGDLCTVSASEDSTSASSSYYNMS